MPKSVKTFEIGKYEVTWGEWQKVRDWAVANGYDLKDVGQGLSESHPVTQVSWYDAVKWCNAKSEMERVTPVYQVKGQVYKTGELGEKGGDTIKQTTSAKGYRLPSEAEWQWAARGGRKSKKYTYAGSNNSSAVGWFPDNSGGKPHPVAQKQANELGIHDMSGNAFEWCGLYPNEVAKGYDGLSNRRVCGGDWTHDNNIAYLGGSDRPNGRRMGLRLARNP
jgi:formylglycine-generating enzyme required for sulfatase activity